MLQKTMLWENADHLIMTLTEWNYSLHKLQFVMTRI